MAWSVQSALCIVVPEHLTSWIQQCRAQHDSAYNRWPPHINLLFPFIPESDFAAQLPRLKTVVGALPKIQLKLHNTSFFKHGSKRFVLILKPEESVAGSLDRLQRAVFDLFPQCTKQREVGGGVFVPHVTLGQFPSQAAVDAKMAELASNPSVDFELDFISLLGRTATGPFECKFKAELGLVAAVPGPASSGYSEDFGGLFSSQSIPVTYDAAQPTAETEAGFEFFGSDVFSPSSPAPEKPNTKAKRTAKSPTTSGIKSSYYKDKPAATKTTPKKSASLLSADSSSPNATPSATTSYTASPSKYAIKIEAPKAPTFSSFATPSTPASVASLGTFSPSKPPAPIVLSSPSSSFSKAETHSSPKPEAKPKTSSYYASKKTHIGRASPSPSEPVETVTFEASSISISAEFAKPLEPVKPQYKVLSAKSKDPLPLPDEFQASAGRIHQWLITLEPSKRPKTRTKLGNAINRMCTIATPGMSPDEALQMLVTKGYISIENDKITILNKGEKSVQRYNMTLNRQLDYQTPQEAAAERCVTWILDPDSKPKSKASLLNTLQQLVQVKKQLPSATIVQHFVESGYLTALQDEKGAEFIEYNL